MKCNCFTREGKNCIEIVPIFSNLNNEEMMEIARITSESSFKKGQLIYMAGDLADKLYVIHSGKVKISRLTESGKEQVIRVLGPGEFMGELSLFSHLPLTDNGEALTDTVACMIDGDKLKELMKKYPAIAFKVMEELSRRLEKTEGLIENISLHSVEKRLGQALVDMADENGQIRLKMSKRDLASHLGMSQETLSRKLTAFQELAMIELVGQRGIRLLNIAALKEIE